MFKPEEKFVAGKRIAPQALALLRHTCLPDPAYPCGHIHSIYYDTPWLSSYAEKSNGDFLKSKLRLRWYEPDISTDKRLRTAFLEVKRKIGSGRRKTRLKQELEKNWFDSTDLGDPRFVALVRESEPRMNEWLHPGMLPTVTISYNRHRFLCPATLARVCLDTHIGVTKLNSHALTPRRHVHIPTAVMEVKKTTEGDIPWLYPFYRLGFRLRSFSKYGECISQLTQED